MRIGKITSSEKYRIAEQFQNFSIVGILIVSRIEKIMKIC